MPSRPVPTDMPPLCCSVCQACEPAVQLFRCAYHSPMKRIRCDTLICEAHAAPRMPRVVYCPLHAWMGFQPVFAPCPQCGTTVCIGTWKAGIGAHPGLWEAVVPPVNPVTGSDHAPTCAPLRLM